MVSSDSSKIYPRKTTDIVKLVKTTLLNRLLLVPRQKAAIEKTNILNLNKL